MTIDGRRFDRFTRALASGASRRDVLKALFGGLAGVAFYAAVPPVAGLSQTYPTFNFAGSLGPGSPQQSNRVYRNGITSTCTAPKPTCPGVFPSGPVFFNAYSFIAIQSCVSVSLTGNCPSLVEVVAYSNSFNPASVCTNYLADPGFSGLQGVPAAFSFNVPFESTFVIVVNMVNSGESCGNYTLAVNGGKPLQTTGLTGIGNNQIVINSASINSTLLPIGAPVRSTGATDL